MALPNWLPFEVPESTASLISKLLDHPKVELLDFSSPQGKMGIFVPREGGKHLVIETHLEAPTCHQMAKILVTTQSLQALTLSLLYKEELDNGCQHM